MDIVTKMRWNWLKETLSLFARENELGDPLDVALKLTSKIVGGQNHMKQHIGKFWLVMAMSSKMGCLP